MEIDKYTNIPLFSNLLEKEVRIKKYEIKNNEIGEYIIFLIDNNEYISYSKVVISQIKMLRLDVNNYTFKLHSQEGLKYNYYILEIKLGG